MTLYQKTNSARHQKGILFYTGHIHQGEWELSQSKVTGYNMTNALGRHY